MGTTDAHLLALDSPLEYFRELVQEALGHQKITASGESEFYLVNLLHDFIDSSHLFQNAPEGKKDEPLALMLARALQSDHHQKIQILKHLGDIALYISGFFPESMHRKIINIDYYIQMGGAAYQTVSTLMGNKIFTKLFEELSTKFIPFVDILSEVSEKSLLKSNPNILQLYEVWLSTRSERVRQILEEQGITPHILPGLKILQ
ncbi:MAG: hypothetical protein A3I75_00785 [Deltaproteobacteria bacterium RIFCSPLOWO2_02_FULL_50_16]|nr:MAG: hypothetical protein A2053_04615 [Deltaproteobacteria bacterium GWA2_50_8]OGQ30515.1 MAG: hypothetical protein A3B79_02545 [Deltaproteobacteria bacterium RIFCSPHIGHO2_02_FULL_50_15]OGQ56363.1 MAG: hypothetical protein A3I75_00785 [Deltaproteobacteria bacterium RIFCSPLOWO2_02_FULL_50_16]OGQ67766.1 MAG: hypothetical protein A3F89_02030 [Deltaproteobacteria bacterium RIFCSPLOWO2_12_FULL_50_11]